MTFSYMFMPPPGPRDPSSKRNKPSLTIPTIMVVSSYALLVSATTDFGQRMAAKVGLGPQALDNTPALTKKEKHITLPPIPNIGPYEDPLDDTATYAIWEEEAQTETPNDVDDRFMPPPTFPPDQPALEPQ